MEENVRYSNDGQTLRIVIPPNMKAIQKFGFGFQGILLLVCTTAVLFLSIKELSDGNDSSGFFFILFFIGCYLLARAYLKRVFSVEIIEVNKRELIITDRFFLSRKTRVYPISKISHFTFAGRQEFTPHPLEIKSFDATGWGVSETEVQTLIEDGTIEFFCNGVTRRFGKNIPSWEAEKMINSIKRFAKNDLSTDDKTEMQTRQLYKKKSNR